MGTTKQFIIAAAAALSLCSCTVERQSPDEAELTLSVCTAATKGEPYTTELAAEKRVSSVTYHVFNSRGQLEAVFEGPGTGGVTQSVSVGQKTVWAVANLSTDPFAGCTTLTEFESRAVSFDDFRTGLHLMAGKASVTVKGDLSRSITIHRMTSRLCIARITNALGEAYGGKAITVRGAFLENIVCGSLVTGDPDPQQRWCNRCGRRDGGTKDNLIASSSDAAYGSYTWTGIGQTVSSGGSIEPLGCLYFFRNACTQDSRGWASPFTPRKTRAVVVAVIGLKTYYYPVSLEPSEANDACTLYLTITHLGSTDPDTEDYVADQDVVIDIGGFDDGDDQEVIY